ncbi:MAG: phosphatidylserine/phosphatidylglycerophosphate/cardiolipin synthase family protein, partial [Planctomycetota bacterium]
DWWPGDDGTDPIRETMLRLGGPVVEQLAGAFERLWGRHRSPLRRKAAGIPGSGMVRMVPQDPRRHPSFRWALYWRIGEARRRIWITTPYFIPPLLLRLALRAARRRGTEVRLLLPGSRHDHPAIRFAGRRYYGNLLRAGIRIWEYQPRFLHAKTAVFDGEWSLAGSPNLDRWSLFLNHEIAVEARDRALAGQLETQFREDLALSREITLPEWRRRPLTTRLLEHFFGVFDRAF